MKRLEGTTILVADDEPMLREVITEMLESEGGEVFSSQNGDEAFALAKQKEIDVVVYDVRMPGGNGVDLLRNLSTLSRMPTVIMMSGFSDLSEGEAVSMGAFALLAKPFRREEILQVIEKALGRRAIKP